MIRTVFASCALLCCLSLPVIAASAPIYIDEPPHLTAEELSDPPSLAKEERYELAAYIAGIKNYYRHKHYQAMGGVFSSIDPFAGDPPTPEERRAARVGLHPAHDPWIFEMAAGLLDEDPVYWELLMEIGYTLNRHIEPDPRTTGLAMRLLRNPGAPLPISDHQDRGILYHPVIRFYGLRPLINEWPEYAAETLAKLATLPHQPEDRELMPGHPETEVETARRNQASWARRTMELLDRIATPEERAEVAAHIEADVEARGYELDDKTAEWLERVREEDNDE